MYSRNRIQRTSIRRWVVTDGERMEEKIKRITTNKEPIKDRAPQIFTERKDGVKPEYNIRTDRSEIAVEAMSNIARQNEKRRMDIGAEAKEGMKKEAAGGDNVATGGAESGTGDPK